MKYRFEDTSIVAGYIKELLHTFNLPSIDAYNEKYSTKYNGKIYIKDNKIVKYINDDDEHHTHSGIKDSFVKVDDYIYNYPVVNFTTNLNIESNVYDKETHEYLGNYLRFLRDYHDLNLMSLYNCFDYREPSKIVHSSKINDKVKFKIDTYDSRYNYYIIPVKFGQKYTIAIDAQVPYEMCCIVNSNSYLEQKLESDEDDDIDRLIRCTYMKVPGSLYTKPFVYDMTAKDSVLFKSLIEGYWDAFGNFNQGFLHREKDFQLLLKLPKAIESSITILEGDFTNSQSLDGMLISNILGENKLDFDSKLSLLKVNNKKSYPFADRLVEYLIGNAITNVDDISSNIERIQDVLYYDDVLKGFYGIWNDDIKQRIYTLAKTQDKTKGKNKRISNTIKISSLQQNKNGSYSVNEETQITLAKKFNDTYSDLLYYVDKDVEQMIELEKTNNG